MAGHSRWAQVKHKKAGSDAKRGALFAKLARLITVAARESDRDPRTNVKLRGAMERARDAGMPKENIERAIARGSGGTDTERLTSVEYEAYGPGGAALLIAGLSDNPNRTTQEVKHILDEFGGRLANMGSVSWTFERKNIYEFAPPAAGKEEFELTLIDAGADDTSRAGGSIRAVVRPARAQPFLEAMAARGLAPTSSTLAAVPTNLVALDAATHATAIALIEALQEHPDITEVWSNVRARKPL